MALTIGCRLGHDDVTALIGEGGMGQVYQATDTKLNRLSWSLPAEVLGPVATVLTHTDMHERRDHDVPAVAGTRHPAIDNRLRR